jgi:hypothetical protein
MAQSSRPEWGLVGAAVALILGGLAILTALATQAPENPWCTWWWVALLVTGVACVVLGLLLSSNYAFGWPNVAARQARREAAHIEAIQAYWSRQHMMDELREELERGDMVWQWALDARRYDIVPENNAWSKHTNSVHLISPEAADALRRAYQARDEIFAASRERVVEDVDPRSLLLTDSDSEERERAQGLYRDAIAKIRAAERPQP